MRYRPPVTLRPLTAIPVAVALSLGLLALPLAVRAQSPSPAANTPITMAVEPLLGGLVRAGAWAGVRVSIQNDGPAVSGELRVASAAQGGSTYAIAVELAPGARQQHVLYAPSPPIGNRLTVSLVSGPTEHVRTTVQLRAIGAATRNVVLVAERPEALVGAIRLGMAEARQAEFVAAGPEDLPTHAEAWASMDVLVWHDTDPGRLDAAQLESLQTWLVTGGDLIILAGSTGLAGSAFPAGMLPFQPTAIVDVPAADVAAMLGSAPVGLVSTPALTGPLQRGTLLGGSDQSAMAARQGHGLGSVTLIGLNPAADWLAGGAQAASFWRLALPSGAAVAEPRLPAGDGFLVQALGDLPAVQLPRTDHLMLLIIGYIVAIGPINYLLLKRRDRREWGWLTMPLTMAAFALATFGLGVVLRGSNVVVNELVLVHGATGADHGLADIHVGVFSPGRATFDVSVGGGALISSPTVGGQFEMPGQARPRPLDVLLGQPIRLRDYGVAFGALRAFRAHAMVPTPRVETDLRLDGQLLTGTITNASAVTLSQVAVVYDGSGIQLGDMAPGQSRTVSVRSVAGGEWGDPLSWQLYQSAGASADEARANAARRALLQHLNGGWEEGYADPSGVLSAGPVVLAAVPGGALEVDVGGPAEHVGQTLYVLSAQASIGGPVVFSGASLDQISFEADSAEGFYDPAAGYFMSRGTLTAEYRPAGFVGAFSVDIFSLRMGFSGSRGPARAGEELLPLPDEEQPDSDAPLASSPRASDGAPDVPRLQLFDHASGSWVEFEPIGPDTTYVVHEPQRYVDGRGTFRVRFVMRTDDYAQFYFGARLEGEVER